MLTQKFVAEQDTVRCHGLQSPEWAVAAGDGVGVG
jgi:hypothetical protein